MAQVLDYSAGKPGALAIVRAGYVGAVRYIGLPGRTKDIDRTEYEDFSRNGIGMALVFEEAAGNWRNGYTQGQIDGRRARDHANAIGFPADRPIYMAIDQDVVTEADFKAMLAYLNGAAASLGGVYVTGVYGEADVIDRVRSEGKAKWFWQTKAWSRGRVTPAHLRQNIGTVYVGGIGCDVNDVLADDWGQHSYGGDMTPDQANQLQFLYDAFTKGGPTTHGEALVNTLWEIKGLGIRTETKVDAGFKDLSNDEANIIAAVRAGGLDPAAFAAIVGPYIKAGATAEEVQAAATEGVRQAFARAGSQEGNTT